MSQVSRRMASRDRLRPILHPKNVTVLLRGWFIPLKPPFTWIQKLREYPYDQEIEVVAPGGQIMLHENSQDSPSSKTTISNGMTKEWTQPTRTISS